MLNDETKKILRKYGWVEDRKINIQHIIDCCEAGGFVVFDMAKNVLQEFGDLMIISPNSEKEINFEVCEIYLDEYEGGMAFYLSKILDENVLQIGTMYSGEYDIYISESGKIYSEGGLIADNIYDAMNYILKTSVKESNNRSVWTRWDELGIDIHKYLASRIGGRGFHDL